MILLLSNPKEINDINCRDRTQYGADTGAVGIKHLKQTICDLFTRDGEVLTCEAEFGDYVIFCWGQTKEKHKAWVDQH